MSKSRIEKLYECLCNGEIADIKPESRVEKYLLGLVSGETVEGVPRSRVEAYLATMCNGGFGKKLENAEESTFGKSNDNEEYGIIIPDTSNISHSTTSRDCITQYQAIEAFNLLGVRVFLSTAKYGRKIKVNINGELKTTFRISNGAEIKYDWNDLIFDQPIAINIGDVIELNETTSTPSVVLVSNVGIDPKIQHIGNDSERIWGVHDIIMENVAVELPDEYKIARSTMDDIAEEMQRISGITNKMSPEQILTALQGM